MTSFTTKLALLVTVLYLAAEVSAQTGAYRKVTLPNSSITRAANFAITRIKTNPTILKKIEAKATDIKLDRVSSAALKIINGVMYEIMAKVICTVNKKPVPVNVVFYVSEFPGKKNTMKLVSASRK